MRLLKIPLLFTVMFLILFTPESKAQITCNDLVKSTIDTVRIRSFVGKPGDTVNVPVRLKTDSIVTAFQFLIEIDTQYFSPVFTFDSTCASVDSAGDCTQWQVDSSFIDFEIYDRFLVTDTSGPFNDIIDTITKFSANLFQGKENVVACNFLPNFTDIDSLPGGNGEIFSIKLEVNPNMPHNQLAEFKFFESDIFTVNDTVFPPETTFFSGCNQSQLTTVWFDGVTTQSFQVFPTSNTSTQMLFRADTGFVPGANPTVNLQANVSSTTPGGSVVLSWAAADADSVIITGTSPSLPFRTVLLNSNTTITAPTTDGVYTYTATAKQNSGPSAQSSVQVTVSSGGGGGGDAPTISFSPTNQSYTINQGETVAFTVNATEPQGDQVTLTANALPNNATFAPSNPVIGTGTASGNFSFTPDFNQSGTFVVSFSASDKDGTSSQAVTIVVNELQVDRLFSTSALDQKPVGGLRSATGIYFPINLVTAKTVYGVQFDMQFPHGYITVDSFVTTGRIPDYVVYDNIGQTPGDIRVVTFGLNNEPVVTDTTTAILWAVMTLADSTQPWTSHTVQLLNGAESVNPDPNVGSLPLVTDDGIVEIDSLGDVNLDKAINVADAVNIVASIIQNYTLSNRQFATADVITNDSVNVFDLVGVVNMIFGIPLPGPSPQIPSGDSAVIMLAYSDIPQGSTELLTITSEGIPEELAGVQMEVRYDPNSVSLGTPTLTTDDDKFVITYRDQGNGKMDVLLYHMAPFKNDELIQIGTADLVDIPVTAKEDVKSGNTKQLRITEAFFSTSEAQRVPVGGVNRETEVSLPGTFVLEQNYPNPFNPETNINFSLSAPGHVKLTVYNVLGQEVITLLDGKMDANPSHQVKWDARNNNGERVSTGVYLYRLKVGDESQTKKMLLLK